VHAHLSKNLAVTDAAFGKSHVKLDVRFRLYAGASCAFLWGAARPYGDSGRRTCRRWCIQGAALSVLKMRCSMVWSGLEQGAPRLEASPRPRTGRRWRTVTVAASRPQCLTRPVSPTTDRDAVGAFVKKAADRHCLSSR